MQCRSVLKAAYNNDITPNSFVAAVWCFGGWEGFDIGSATESCTIICQRPSTPCSSWRGLLDCVLYFDGIALSCRHVPKVRQPTCAGGAC
eukprot:1400157-Amphidinium_carterae.1